ncbi:MAG: hypothetical protein LBI34_01570 [Puniceicoccales bacterium]|jgi:hypothetical protein|nr:hypothetical protein [Puniceicoccales bacterium]
MSNFGVGNAFSRVRVVDMDTGEVLQPSVSPASPDPGGTGRSVHSDWDARVLIASWAALYPEMTDQIGEWIEDAWKRGFSIQLTESLVRKRVTMEESRIRAARAMRQEQIDDPVARRYVTPANAYEARLIDLKDSADHVRSGAGAPRGDVAQDVSRQALPPELVVATNPPRFEFGISRVPPELQPEMDAADKAFDEAVALRIAAGENLERAKAECAKMPSPMIDVPPPPPAPEKKTSGLFRGSSKKRDGA